MYITIFFTVIMITILFGGNMKQEVFLYITASGINEFNEQLSSIAVEDKKLATKVIRVFSSSKIQFVPDNDTATVYYWKSIDWDISREAIYTIVQLLNSLSSSKYYLITRDPKTGEGVTTGSLSNLVDSFIRQGIQPHPIKYITLE